MALLVFPEGSALGQPVFDDRTREAGLKVQAPFGIAALDYDKDGWPDLMVAADSAESKLFRNLGNGHYADETARTGLSLAGSFHSPLFADLNRDGWADLLMVGTEDSRLFLSDGAGAFVDHSRSSGLLGAGAKTATLGDFDNDGLLDLFLAISHQPDRLFRNLGNGVFEDISAEAQIEGPTGALAMQALWWDFNHDGWLDLVAVHDVDEPSRLYRNDGTLPFTDVALETGFSAVGSGNSMGVGLGDIDGDGWEDVYVTRIQEGGLYRNEEGVSLTLMEDALGAWRNGWSWGVVAGDFDNDADQDLFIVSTSGMGGAPILLYENRGTWLYERSSTNWLQGSVPDSSVAGAFSFGLAQADLDLDGRIDLAYPAQDGRVVLLHGAGPVGNWIQIQLEGTSANYHGMGARIEARTRSRVFTRSLMAGDSYRSQSEPVVHLGLGADDMVEELVVHWGGSQRDTLRSIPAGSRYIVRQGAGATTSLGQWPAQEGPEAPASIDAFPLPAHSRVMLRIHGELRQPHVSLTDLLGRELPARLVPLSESDPWEASLDVDGLSSGVYWVRVTDGEHVFSRAISVMR
ncbi:MAG: hypothetical protein HKN29_12665 [Rhodothermales bacterium]|nr:hypothetical protein [Rhodothermales bacterium]